MSRTLLNPPTIHGPGPSYTHISSIPISPTHKLVTIAGQVGMDPTDSIPSDFASQVHLAFENLGKCLEHAGCSRDDVTGTRLFIVGKAGGENGGEEEGKARKDAVLGFFGEGKAPPDVLMYVAGLAMPELMFEVEAMAVAKI